jgi:hypothetical protein
MVISKPLRYVGDTVYFTGCTPLTRQDSQFLKIKKVDWVLDEKTNDKFPIYHIGDGEWYDGRNGGCYSKKESLYYLEL